MSFLKDFKEFAVKGNVIDMAVGIIIGGAFGKIVSSFVNDIIMPPIGMLLGNSDFKDLAVVLKPATDEVAQISINYGVFFNHLLDFIIIALSIFVAVRVMMKLKKQEEPAPEPGPEEKLLEEIRDLLKKQ